MVPVRVGATAGVAGDAGANLAGSGTGDADAADPAAGDAGDAGGVPAGAGEGMPAAASERPAPVRYRSNPHRGLSGLDLSPADGGGAA